MVLTDDRQVNPDTISWGYRGGTLDVNGNSLTFHQLKAADYGAVLINNNEATRAVVTLDFDTDKYLFHGQLKGSLDVTNVVTAGNTDTLLIDGSADMTWICPYISRHLLSLNPLQARCRRYSRGER